MSSLDSTFELLQSQLKGTDALNPAKSDPVFYFIHAPEDTLALKQKLPLWAAKLRQDDLQVQTVSMAELAWKIIDGSGRWESWLEAEPDAEPADINSAMRDVLRGDDGLIGEVAALVSEPIENRVLFLTDTGLLHPYFRVRTLESGLHDRVKVPMVIFYPGKRSGQYGLKFLGFYSVDGNYRSTLVGGTA
jgi:hypothetical protein